MIPNIVLDIETLALPEDQIRASLPPFNADRVKLGVAKKPETIEKIIEEARASYGNDIVERAALDPRYGQVAIVGLLSQTGYMTQISLHECDDEKTLLSCAWDGLNQFTWAQTISPIEDGPQTVTRSLVGTPIIGFNIKAFDLPFLVARSLILSVQVPASIWNPRHRYPFSDRVCDLMEVMSFGNKSRQYSSLDDALRMFGIPVNPHGDGSKFGELWAKDKAKALEYNAYDLTSEQELAAKLGLV